MYLADSESMPPVPAAGSNIVRTMLFLERISLSGRKSRSTIRRMTSRGVKWSPASSLAASLNFRTNSSKVRPISRWETRSGWRSTSANFIQVGDAVGMEVDFGELLEQLEEAGGLIELLDLLVEGEVFEQRADLGRETVDVVEEVGRDVLGLPLEPFKVVLTGVVELLAGGLLEHLVDVAGALTF